jgi:hypothetical protein
VKNERTLWIIVLVLLLVLCLCCAAALTLAVVGGWRWGNFMLSSQIESTDHFTRTLDVQAPINLTLDVPVGDLTVRGGPGQQVVVEVTRRAWGWNQAAARQLLERINVYVEQAGSQVQIKVTGVTATSGGPRSPQVNIVVMVPQQTTLTLDSRVGRVSVSGTQGDVEIKADVGDVTLTNVLPAERLSVESRVASVELSGALAENAEYELISDVGRIVVRVPPDSSFSLDARSDIGDVKVEFPVSGRSERQGFVGKQVYGTVGTGPAADLYLRSRVGDISVRPTD